MCKGNENRRVEENERMHSVLYIFIRFYIYFVCNSNMSDFYPRKEIKTEWD